MDKNTRRAFLKKMGLVGGGLSVSSLLSNCAGLSEFGELGLGPGLMPTLLIKPGDMARKFQPHFPVSRSYQGLVNMQFSDPVFGMAPDINKVRVGLTTLGSLSGLLNGGRQVGGRCQLACGLRYDPQTRGIFLKDAVLENFSLAGVPSQWTSGLKQVANVLGQNYLEKHPVYKLNDGLGTSLLKSMVVQENGIKLSFGI